MVSGKDESGYLMDRFRGVRFPKTRIRLSDGTQSGYSIADIRQLGRGGSVRGLYYYYGWCFVFLRGHKTLEDQAKFRCSYWRNQYIFSVSRYI